MPNLTKLLSDVLSLPEDALAYETSRRLHDLFPDRFILETEDYDFELADYEKAGKCMVHHCEDAFGHYEAKWISAEEGIDLEARNAFLEIHWRGLKLHCLTMRVACSQRHYIIAESSYVAHDFFNAVCSLEVDPTGEILVFKNGYWDRDAELVKKIETASLDQVVMPAGMKENLVADVEAFFAGKEMYGRYGLAWKRGLLLLGNPGNGKTLTIKALVNHASKPCLYVRSLRSEFWTVHRNIGKVFRRARAVAPCILVLEDLDSLVEKDDISFLLNELDGFSANEGILTIATTNHPEKLDPALLHRPSRFDRKIEFKDPETAERLRYLEAANSAREPGLRLRKPQLQRVAQKTEGFSYAYLKELNLSALSACIIGGKPLREAMDEAVELLVQQVRASKQGCEDN